MKKILRVVVVFCMFTSIFLAFCTAQKGTVEGAKKDIDKKLVHKVAGSWVANNYDYGNYELVYDGKTLTYNSMKLEIEYTEGNRVFTHQAHDKTAHYIFEAKEDEIIVYPSYKVEQSGDELVVGGDLAPIELKKTRTISKESIFGRWKSVESDFPAFIQVRATFDPNKIDLLIAQTEESEKNEIIPLTFETGESELIYLNKEKTIRYSFSYYEETKMLLNSATTEEGVEGTARPWILERVVE
ncbi:hypothetical protein A5821_001347 [Enterococcus sp. 7F3_DIV0205]|uniref:Uncharacterized protein n=1 Tax=Candidatus Enterococcus palustris TaxID=1834189 RepID=A0AAQ3W7P7_9ENTE|nr:hypothetical protein [Enterococcus sp. 7F3_DIV0205]OTN85745.1 hypothetical protein A5821_001691 [Enterococcus sp. 7F3_DIV0205]